MSRERQIMGLDGEEMAARHLQGQGYRIVARRYRTRFGEVDLVAARGSMLVFVEVKTRRGMAYGPPAGAVHGLKQARLARVASHFLQTHRLFEATCRFDVIAIVRDPAGRASLEHIEDAFRPV